MRNPYGDGLRSRSRQKISDGLAGHASKNVRLGVDLEQVPALERLARHLDERRVLAGRVVAVALDARRARVRVVDAASRDHLP